MTRIWAGELEQQERREGKKNEGEEALYERLARTSLPEGLGRRDPMPRQASQTKNVGMPHAKKSSRQTPP